MENKHVLNGNGGGKIIACNLIQDLNYSRSLSGCHDSLTINPAFDNHTQLTFLNLES